MNPSNNPNQGMYYPQQGYPPQQGMPYIPNYQMQQNYHYHQQSNSFSSKKVFEPNQKKNKT